MPAGSGEAPGGFGLGSSVSDSLTESSDSFDSAVGLTAWSLLEDELKLPARDGGGTLGVVGGDNPRAVTTSASTRDVRPDFLAIFIHIRTRLRMHQLQIV